VLVVTFYSSDNDKQNMVFWNYVQYLFHNRCNRYTARNSFVETSMLRRAHWEGCAKVQYSTIFILNSKNKICYGRQAMWLYVSIKNLSPFLLVTHAPWKWKNPPHEVTSTETSRLRFTLWCTVRCSRRTEKFDTNVRNIHFLLLYL
jgi:hypothetical protein